MDITSTRSLIHEARVVVMDDFRALHTPGVAAATWGAVATDGLIPICLSEQKFYGAWDPDMARATSDDLADWLAAQGDAVNYGMQEIASSDVLVVENQTSHKFKERVQRIVPTALRGSAAVRPYLGSRPH